MDLRATAWRSPEGEPGGGDGHPGRLPGSASDAAPAASDPDTSAQGRGADVDYAAAGETGAPASEGDGGQAAGEGGGVALELEAPAVGTADIAQTAVAIEAPVATPRRESFREWIKDHDESWIFVVIYLGLAVGLSVFVSLFWLVAVAGLHLGFELVRQAHYRDGKTNVFLHALWEIKLDVGLVLLALMLVLYIEVVLGLLGVQSAARAAAVTRAGARLGSRAAAWERNLRTFLLTVDEMVRIVYAGVMLRRRANTPEEEAEAALQERSGADEGVEATLEAAAREAEKGEERRRKADKAAARKRKVADAILRRQEAADRKRAARAGPTGAGAAGRPAISAWRAPWGMADRIGVALVAIGVLLIMAAPYLTPHDWGTATAALLGELRPFPQ